MTTLSVSIPSDLKTKMFEFDCINWSAVAKKAFESKVEELELFKKISEKSKLNENGAKELSDLVSKGMSKRFLEMKK